MPSLQVVLYDTVVGALVGDSWRDFDFVTSSEGLDRFGIGSTILSESVPLVLRQPRGKAARRRNFFAELLPEGPARERLANRIRVSATDTLSLLAAYGRDVAGAVAIIDPDAREVIPTPKARLVTHAKIGGMLTNMADFPLGNAPITGKASLAGVQDKILLAHTDGGWAQCLYGFTSTHILKPVTLAYPDMIYNEEYGARFARALGVARNKTWIESFDGVDALVIERYDRTGNTFDGRLHQEDMNQVLGASGVQKYQEDGGRVSLARVAAVVSSHQGRPGLEELLCLVTLAVAVGNLDMHAKNISLLHLPDGSARLAPAYDVVPLAHYPGVDGRMAMSVNGVYEQHRISRGDLVAEAKSWGLGTDRAEAAVERTVLVIRDTAQREQPHARAYAGLPEAINTAAGRLVETDNATRS